MGKEFFFDDSLARYMNQDMGAANHDLSNIQPGKPVYRKPFMESFEPTVWGQTNFGCVNNGCSGGTNVMCTNVGCV
jgi:hypothetical protein